MNDDFIAAKAAAGKISSDNEAIIRAGFYTHPKTGQRVDLAQAVDASCSFTRLYDIDDTDTILDIQDGPLTPVSPAIETVFEVTSETSTEAGRRLYSTGGPMPRVMILNFASAKHPGGGYLTGAKAQEEDLCRSSALYTTLTTQVAEPFYRLHSRERDNRYSHRIIFSPDVPVYRDGDGQLLPDMYRISYLTCAAPNIGALQKSNPRAVQYAPDILIKRARRILAVAAHHSQRVIVLGAWGCGVFQNDPEVVARTFKQLLVGKHAPFHNRFERVVFAVFERRAKAPTLAEFVKAFPPGRNTIHLGIPSGLVTGSARSSTLAGSPSGSSDKPRPSSSQPSSPAFPGQGRALGVSPLTGSVNGGHRTDDSMDVDLDKKRDANGDAPMDADTPEQEAQSSAPNVDVSSSPGPQRQRKRISSPDTPQSTPTRAAPASTSQPRITQHFKFTPKSKP